MSEKNSFVLYFDMYPSIRELSVEQRGALFSAIFEYAVQEARQPDSGQAVLKQHPELSDASKMAFYFITKAIGRDTAKWHEKHQRYVQAAEKRWEERSADSRPAEKETRRTNGRRAVQNGSAWEYI